MNMDTPNRFFLYEGEIIIAANYRLHEVLKYYEEGRKVFYGTPQEHGLEITKLASKLIFKTTELISETESFENTLTNK